MRPLRHSSPPVNRTEIYVPSSPAGQGGPECTLVGRDHSHGGLEPGDALLEGLESKYEILGSPAKALSRKVESEKWHQRVQIGMTPYRHLRKSNG